MTLVEAYEAKHSPIGLPSFEAAVEYEIEKRGLPREQGESILISDDGVNSFAVWPSAK